MVKPPQEVARGARGLADFEKAVPQAPKLTM